MSTSVQPACERPTTSDPAVGSTRLVRPVTALCVRSDSIYKTLGVNCYDATRDCRNYHGPNPVIAHPPCGRWGKLKRMSQATDEEKSIGPWAVAQVRSFGGVLEHPAYSTLWKAAGLPRPGKTDSYGGYTLDIDQYWWGHRAQKRTWLYVCGCNPRNVPAIPIKLGTAPRVITNRPGLKSGQPGYRKKVTKRERDATPPELAQWLVELASRCVGPNAAGEPQIPPTNH